LAIHVPENNASLSSFPFRQGRGTNLSPIVLYDKIVAKRRGGFCFELNGCFARVLRGIGFEVQERIARVCLKDPTIPAEGADWAWLGHTHQVLLVKTKDKGDQVFVVDVGFGSHGLFSPIEFKNNANINGVTENETHVLRNESMPGNPQMPIGWTLYRSYCDENNNNCTRACYHFLDIPPLPIDFEIGNWWVTTNGPRFSKTYMVTRVDTKKKTKLNFLMTEGDPHAQFYVKGENSRTIEKREVDNFAEAKAIWKNEFGLDVDTNWLPS